MFDFLKQKKQATPALEGNEIRRLVEQAMAELQAKTIAHDAMIHFQECQWEADQDEGRINFERPGGLRATAPVQIIGSYNADDGTWLWGWDHPSVVEPLQRDAKAVKAYGHQHNIAALTTRKLECAESDCWEFAALACKLCDAQGAYRGPAGSTRIFMTFGQVTLEKAQT